MVSGVQDPKKQSEKWGTDYCTEKGKYNLGLVQGDPPQKKGAKVHMGKGSGQSTVLQERDQMLVTIRGQKPDDLRAEPWKSRSLLEANWERREHIQRQQIRVLPMHSDALP